MQITNKHYRWLFWITIVAVYILAMLPQESAPSLGWGDKGNHILAFVVMSILLILSYRISLTKVALLMVAYGVWIEISQYFTPTRSADYRDVVADSIGVAIAILIYRVKAKLW